MKSAETAEGRRLAQTSGKPLSWKRWGPYVSERSWSSVREDYSPNGAAWEYLTHDMARRKAYRWGEDGLAGICDRYQILVFALALWNTKDPILKERAFGLTPAEGNHGEDVKEYYFYLDSTPTHSYMKYLYKYPQTEFPYAQLIDENRRREGRGAEFELLDTGIFDQNKYFDVFVEYAKASEEDICIRIEAFNRGPDAAPLHLIPHLWFRNTWAWSEPHGAEPNIKLEAPAASNAAICLVADDASADPLRGLPFQYKLGKRYLYAEPGGEALFTDNESDAQHLYGVANYRQFLKNAFHEAIIHGKGLAVNPKQTGTKACLNYHRVVKPGESFVVRLRLTPEKFSASAAPQTARQASALASPLYQVDEIIAARRAEADEFYEAVHPPRATKDERLVQRQALAGMLWSKQIYLFDVNLWLEGDNLKSPPPRSRWRIRNRHWRHLNSKRILSMPDKWEYPWFAAWDLAFQSAALAVVDGDFAKEQLWLLLFEQFQHPNGQIPAYEWEFSDLNPPVHAWAVWRVYNMDRLRSGHADREWLERCFHKLLINFAWWVNKVDSSGNNVFEGGFLGLDNITVVDRSDKLPNGAVLEQSDATGWMGMFCLNLMRIALELAKEDKVYESMATKFFEHYIYIGAAMNHMGGRDYSLWDEDDGFFYDILRYADGSFHKFRVRSLVGVIPLFAVERLELDWIEPFTEFRDNFHWFVKNRQELAERCCHYREHDNKKVYVLTIASERKLRRLIERLYDPQEFLSDYGIRSLSKFHEQHPFVYGSSEVRYDPAESDNKIKGGNSNWRGPIWLPTTFLLIESLRKLGAGYGASFQVEGKNNGGPRSMTDMAGDIANRIIKIFTRNEKGLRPVYGGTKKFQQDPYWKDLVLFHEYFHGENGAGLGASHQTGWTGVVACLIDEWRR